MQLSPETLRSLLEELAEWLDFEDCDPVEWVVCGGVALALQGLQNRTTRDVDVLGNWNVQTMEIACIEAFPEKVRACILRVVQRHPELSGFSESWINLGPRQLAKRGLPDGFATRLTTVRFGPKLTLHLLGRTDLLPLKLYAAADEWGSRQAIHLQDLKLLKPSREELDLAVEWVRTMPDFEEKRLGLKEAARELGYDDAAYYI
ncbi:MAG: hypothetical protein NTW19_01745 [Planctomycetota bacterium]|nr:hypothetical protein [Planctomycetota bacterium]